MNRIPRWFSGTFIVFGLLVMAVGSGLFSVESDAPGWAMVMVGAFFAMCGLVAATAHLGDVRLTLGLVALSVLCMTSVFGWVAFGPGEREFVLEVGAGVGDARGSGYGSGNPVVGRTVFGIATVLLGLLAAGLGWLVFMAYRRGDGAGAGSTAEVDPSRSGENEAGLEAR